MPLSSRPLNNANKRWLTRKSVDRNKENTGDWLYGLHTVRAAVSNPARHLRRLLLSKEIAGEPWLANLPRHVPYPETVERAFLDRLLPEAVHQGIALLADPLEAIDLETFLSSLDKDDLLDMALFLILDQIEDPHNVGAIIRSAAAFSATALILAERHAPALKGVLAKAASGALEFLPIIRVVNISRTLRLLSDYGVINIGLEAAANDELADVVKSYRSKNDKYAIALVLGSEGKGLRRLTIEGCNTLVRLPTTADFASLNVSNAAAVAIYAVRVALNQQ